MSLWDELDKPESVAVEDAQMDALTIDLIKVLKRHDLSPALTASTLHSLFTATACTFLLYRDIPEAVALFEGSLRRGIAAYRIYTKAKGDHEEDQQQI